MADVWFANEYFSISLPADVENHAGCWRGGDKNDLPVNKTALHQIQTHRRHYSA